MDFNALYGMHAKDKMLLRQQTHTLQAPQMIPKLG